MKETELQELEKALRAASSAPWRAYVNERDGAWYVSRRPGDVTGKKFYIFRMDEGDDAPDALLIPLLRNAAPSLISDLRSARRERDEARAQALWEAADLVDRMVGRDTRYEVLEALRALEGNAAQPPPDSSAALLEARRLLGHAVQWSAAGRTVPRDLHFEIKAFLGEQNGKGSEGSNPVVAPAKEER